MTAKTYLIEQNDGEGGPWYIVGSEQFEYPARGHFNRYVGLLPNTLCRVVEQPSGRVVIQSGTIEQGG